MIKILFGLFIIISLLCPPTLAFQEIQISFRAPENQPYFVGAPEMNIDAEEFTTVVLRMKSNKGGAACLFWATNFDPKMNDPKSIWFSLDKSNDFKEYVFNLRRQNPYWTGFVGQLLVYPENGPGGIEIESAKAIPGNLVTDIKSGWREFFIFETPQLRTVNFIYGPKINAISVNLYIYGLIIILAVFIMSYEFIKSHNINMSLETGAKKIIVICLFFWIALDFRILIDQARTAFLDAQTFYGKNLDEKRALITLGDYYGFLKFAELKLPEGSSFKLLNPPYYYYLGKANYYLYPIRFDEKADHILVYDPDRILGNQVSDYFKKGYKLFATYKEGEYILKK